MKIKFNPLKLIKSKSTLLKIVLVSVVLLLIGVTGVFAYRKVTLERKGENNPSVKELKDTTSDQGTNTVSTSEVPKSEGETTNTSTIPSGNARAESSTTTSTVSTPASPSAEEIKQACWAKYNTAVANAEPLLNQINANMNAEKASIDAYYSYSGQAWVDFRNGTYASPYNIYPLDPLKDHLRARDDLLKKYQPQYDARFAKIDAETGASCLAIIGH